MRRVGEEPPSLIHVVYKPCTGSYVFIIPRMKGQGSISNTHLPGACYPNRPATGWLPMRWPYQAYVKAFLRTSLFLDTFQGTFSSDNRISTIYDRIRSIRYQNGKLSSIKRQKNIILVLQVLLTGLWNLKDIQNFRQNRSKNKLVRENAVTRAYGSCSLRVMGSW